MCCFVSVDDVFGSKSNIVSLNVIAPQFSIAPDAKSGIAIMSSLGNGYAILKYFSKYDRNCFVNSSESFPCCFFPFVVITLMSVLPDLLERNSNSPTARYSKYVDMIGVVSNLYSVLWP